MSNDLPQIVKVASLSRPQYSKRREDATGEGWFFGISGALFSDATRASHVLMAFATKADAEAAHTDLEFMRASGGAE